MGLLSCTGKASLLTFEIDLNLTNWRSYMFKKSLLALALGTTASLTAMSAHAVAVNTGDVLSIASGSFFGMDTDKNKIITASEQTALSMGTTGIVIGSTTSQGASHSSGITSGDTNAVDAPWNFFGNTGSDYIKTTPITGSTTAGLNMAGWTVTWNGIAAIPMGSGAWAPVCDATETANCSLTYTSGSANFAWDGVSGHTYTLDYTATVPKGDPSGFGLVKYYLHLTGTVTAVPEASTYGMMLAGLGLVGFAARRRKQA